MGAASGWLSWERHQKINQAEKEDLLKKSWEISIHDLRIALAATEAQLEAASKNAAKPATSTQDPALLAQIASLNVAIASLAESQKGLAAKLASPISMTTTPAATSYAPTITTDKSALLANSNGMPNHDLASDNNKPSPIITPAQPIASTSNVNTLEAAYKQAWENDKPVVIGQVKDPQTGNLSGGRILDPAGAKAIGVITWREWYLSEEQARREELIREAQLQFFANQERLAEIPKASP